MAEFFFMAVSAAAAVGIIYVNIAFRDKRDKTSVVR